MKPNDFTITCNKCRSNDVKILSYNVSYVIITEIRCENAECKHVEQI
jgi:hypothetical protein